MTELMTRQEVAKELLKPYFDDPSICSVSEDSGKCLYDGPDGKMCAFARACTPEGRKILQEEQGVFSSLEELGYDILQDKYRHIDEHLFWNKIQGVHDNLANGSDNFALARYEELTGEQYQRS